jgi:WD40 repeat protein
MYLLLLYYFFITKGGGRNPRYPTNKVMIWDDHQNKCIGELMFKSEVFAVRLRRDRVVVVLGNKVYVYRFSDLKLLDQITTVSNTKGLISLCADPSNNTLALPGLAIGSIRVELYDIKKVTIIKAHDSDLAQFTLNSDGSKLVSASDKGTLIRLWDCHTGDSLREFRRGMDRAEIYCLAFDPSSGHLACSSDKGTVHVYSLHDTGPTSVFSSVTDRSSGNSYSSTNQSGGAGTEKDRTSSSDKEYVDRGNKGMGGLSFLKGVLPTSMVLLLYYYYSC